MTQANVDIFHEMLTDTFCKSFIQTSEENRRTYIESRAYSKKGVHIKSILEAYDWYMQGKSEEIIIGYLIDAPFCKWPFKQKINKPLNIIGTFNGFVSDK